MKVLIISHIPTCTYNNMGKTIASLFSEFSKDELCQLYIYPCVPDLDMCSSYFRITDKNALESIYRFKSHGCVVGADNTDHLMYENKSDEKFYKKPKNASMHRLVLRDVMWKISHWFSPELKNWITQQNCDCIFLAPGKNKFIYDIAQKISKHYDLPIVSYFADDFYFLNDPPGVFGHIQFHSLRKKIDGLLSASKHLITICEPMKKRYGEKFSLPVTSIMTGYGLRCDSKFQMSDNVNVLTYMGNIEYNRYVSLFEIGKALDNINEQLGTAYELHIYSGDMSDEASKRLSTAKSIKYLGFVSGKDYEDVFINSDILVHVEAFDSVNIELVRYSISTKIADCLANGKPMLAYGPKQVASMQHLYNNDCAACAFDRADLEHTLLNVLKNKSYREALSKNALAAAAKYHERKTNSEILHKILTLEINEDTD